MIEDVLTILQYVPVHIQVPGFSMLIESLGNLSYSLLHKARVRAENRLPLRIGSHRRLTRWHPSLRVSRKPISRASSPVKSVANSIPLNNSIGHMDGIAGLRGWRWIMIIEGLPTVILGISIWWWFADSVATARYLTPREKEIIDLRRRLQIGHTKSSDEMHKADVYEGFRDWKIWLFCAGQFGGDMVLYGFSTFLPTIIKGLGSWSVAEVQALTIPCYALGAISYIVVAWCSDRTQKRAIFTVVFGLICVVGYAILISTAPGGVRYFGCFLVACGLYVIVGLPLAWLPSNNPRYGKRTVATGLQLTIGNSAGIAAPFIYPTGDAPRFVKGHAISMAMAAMSAVIFLGLWAWFRRQNRRKLSGLEDHKAEGMTEEEAEELGEHNPRFLYAY